MRLLLVSTVNPEPIARRFALLVPSVIRTRKRPPAKSALSMSVTVPQDAITTGDVS